MRFSDLPFLRGRARRWRGLVLFAAGTALVATAVAGWLGVRGLGARSALHEARGQLVALQRGLTGGTLQANDASRAMDAVAANTARARQLTSDPLWRVTGALPKAGCPLRSTAALSAVADSVTRDVVGPLAAIGPAALPSTSADGVRLNVHALQAAAPQLRSALNRVPGLTATVTAVSTCGSVGGQLGLPAARTELLAQLSRLQASAGSVAVASRILPDMLGAKGPRRYLLVVQNDAESRATGGILGAVGVLSARDGHLSLGSIVGNSAVPRLPSGFSMPLADDVRTRYARNGLIRYWQDANLTPDFPTAARIYAAMWEASTQQTVDGVLALDPATLGYLVSGTGPVRMPDGRAVSGPELVPLLQSQLYAQISDDAARDRYFAAAGGAIYSQILSGQSSSMRLLPALARSVREGRLLLWSADSREQLSLVGTQLAGAVPTARGPYLAVVTQNAASGKLDYYLHRKTQYSAQQLPDGSGTAAVTVRLTNRAPRTGLTPYVLAHDLQGRPIVSNHGRNVIYLSVYGGIGATFDGATVDGRPVSLESEIERGHSVFSTWVTLDAGQTKTVRITLAEPDWRPVLTVRPQPLVNPESLTVTGIRVQQR